MSDFKPGDYLRSNTSLIKFIKYDSLNSNTGELSATERTFTGQLISTEYSFYGEYYGKESFGWVTSMFKLDNKYKLTLEFNKQLEDIINEQEELNPTLWL